MRLNDSSEVIYFDNEPISVAEQINLGFPRNMRCYARNVVKIGNKYYYAKKCSINTLINELVGSYYSSLIGLDVVDSVVDDVDAVGFDVVGVLELVGLLLSGVDVVEGFDDVDTFSRFLL